MDAAVKRNPALDTCGAHRYGKRVTMQELLEEYGFEIDDIRWYLAVLTADRMFTYRDRPEELARLIWSGGLEKDLYNMEERFLERLQTDLDRNHTDEAHVRQILAEVAHQKAKRRRARFTQPGR